MYQPHLRPLFIADELSNITPDTSNLPHLIHDSFEVRVAGGGKFVVDKCPSLSIWCLMFLSTSLHPSRPLSLQTSGLKPLSIDQIRHHAWLLHQRRGGGGMFLQNYHVSTYL
jgi:hypothetical protein